MSSEGDLTESDRPTVGPKLAVIAALGVERKCLPLQRQRFLVLQSGPGPERAADAARRAVDAGATALLSWGLAGALVPDLQSGSIVLPSSVANQDGYIAGVSARWRDAIALELRDRDVRDGILLSVNRTLLGPEEKSSAGRSFGATACDMESAAIAETAALSGVDFAVIRVIADELDDRLPDRVEQFVDVCGNARVMPLIWAAMNRGQWKPILRAVSRFGTARRSLVGIAGRLAPRDFHCQGNS